MDSTLADMPPSDVTGSPTCQSLIIVILAD